MAALLELQFLPPVWYFTQLIRHPVVVIEQWEHYQKRSYRNRCHIATSLGVQRLSIPLQKGKNQQMPIREVRIAYDQPWQKQHEQTLRAAYRRAPFFEEYATPLLETLRQEHEFLFDLNLQLLDQLIEFLGIKTEITFTGSFSLSAPDNCTDLRNTIHPLYPAADQGFLPAHYNQVFEDRHGFSPNLSIIDLLFCMGPEAPGVLKASIK